MSNNSGIVDPQYPGIMADATRRQLEQKGAVVLGPQDMVLKAQAKVRNIPVYRIDGQLSRLSQNQGTDGSLMIQARVEFSVVKVPQQTLQGTLSGAAATQSSGSALSNAVSMQMLRQQVIGGAVESAMQNADRRLLATIH
jgi:hypothetical protein